MNKLNDLNLFFMLFVTKYEEQGEMGLWDFMFPSFFGGL